MPPNHANGWAKIQWLDPLLLKFKSLVQLQWINLQPKGGLFLLGPIKQQWMSVPRGHQAQAIKGLNVWPIQTNYTNLTKVSNSYLEQMLQLLWLSRRSLWDVKWASALSWGHVAYYSYVILIVLCQGEIRYTPCVTLMIKIKKTKQNKSKAGVCKQDLPSCVFEPECSILRFYNQIGCW